MKRIMFLQVTILLLFAVSAMFAQEKTKGKKTKEATAKETTIKGEVVDLACYMKHGATGEDHKACAEACAKGGGSLGILTTDGKLYVSLLPDDHSTSPNTILMDHISHQVEATGVIRKKGGVQGIMIKKVEMAKAEGDEKKEDKHE